MHREMTLNYRKTIIRYIALLVSAVFTMMLFGGCVKKETGNTEGNAQATEAVTLTATPAPTVNDGGNTSDNTQGDGLVTDPEPTKPEGYSGNIGDSDNGYIGLVTLDDEKDYPLCVYDGISYAIFEDHAEVLFTFYSDDALESYKVREKVPYDGKDYTVTALMEDAFMYFFDAKEIILPDTIETIGEYAFASCEGITAIDIPASVKSIGQYAFSDCIGLKEITIPGTVERIGAALFSDCIELEKVTIEAKISGVPDECFSGCTLLTEINLPDTITSLGTESFWYCEALESLEIGEGVSSIGERAFYSCTSLKSIKLPANLTSIATDCFDYCDELEEFIVPESELEYYEEFLAGYDFIITTY